MPSGKYGGLSLFRIFCAVAQIGDEGKTMWKILLALSLAALEVATPALAQEVPGRSFEETLKLILFGDSAKSESIHFATDGATTKVVLTGADEKACLAGMIIQEDKPNHGETKTTLTLDFDAVDNWRRSGSVFLLEGGIQSSPVVMSIKIEWLRIDNDRAKNENPRSDEFSFGRYFSLPSKGGKQRATEAMSYLMDKLCHADWRFGPSIKF